VLTDRSIGGASLKSGEIELMIQRRILADDRRGVREPLNETAGVNPDGSRVGPGMHVTGSHYLFADLNQNSMRNFRALQSRIFQPLALGFTALSQSPNQWIQSHLVSGSMAQQELPLNVDLMTFQAVPGEGILRLSHQFGVDEDSALSTPATVDLQKLFVGMNQVTFTEVSLTTNQPAKDIKIFNWEEEGPNADDNKKTFSVEPFNGQQVTINPLDVRTFTFKTNK